MRTTKVKRLWPVLALAPLFALAAIFGVSLWHSGPTALTPPAAEANGRALEGAAVTPAGNTCPVAHGTDARCISNEDTLTVVVSGLDTAGNATYVTGASGEAISVSGPHRVYPNIQAVGASDAKLGKKGVGSYLLAPTGVTGNSIDVKRSWADNDGKVWVLIDDTLATPVVTGNALRSPFGDDDTMVEIFFTQSIDTTQAGAIQNLGDADLPAKEETSGMPTDRDVAIADAEDDETSDVAGSIRFNVNPQGADIDGQAIHLGGRIIVTHEFTAGSALMDDIEMTGSVTHPAADADVAVPSLSGALIPVDEATGIPLTGWETSGAVELTVNVTHISGTGERTAFDPFTLYREGPADAIVFADNGGPPTDPHRTTGTSTNYEGFGPLAINDVLGRTATEPARLIYEGADAAAAAILPDAETARELDYGDVTGANKFPITIKNTATTGMYEVNFVAQSAPDENDMRTDLATLGVTVTVIGAPDAVSGTVASNLVNPGTDVELTGVALTSGGENAFDPPCEGATTGTSICTWTAKDAATEAVLASRSGPVGTDGTVSIPVNATAAPGTYTIVLSDTRTQGVAAPDRATSKEVSFTVVGRPATYTLTGPDRIAAGQIGAFMVTAKDANGNLPYFPMDEPTAADVSIVVSGAGAASVTPLRLSEGKVSLNARGEASFQVRVNNNAPSGSITIDAVGLGDGLASKTVTIGPEALGAPTGLMLGTMSDDTGTVTLAWTAGANSTQHWIAGIKKEDLDAGNVGMEQLLWEAADTQTGHTFTGLEGGKVYLFTVTAGNAANEWSAWAPIREVTVGTPAPTSGGGPGNPFGGSGN